MPLSGSHMQKYFIQFTITIKPYRTHHRHGTAKNIYVKLIILKRIHRIGGSGIQAA